MCSVAVDHGDFKRVDVNTRSQPAHTGTVSDQPDDELGSSLPLSVVERLRSEFGPGADRITRCLRTARVLINQARDDDRGLRLAESAAYNVREALDTVTADQTAAEGGLGAVMKAWKRYCLETAQDDADISAARAALHEVLGEVEADTVRTSHSARRLLTYLYKRAGVAPTTRRDPVAEYADLRAQANTAVHTQFGLSEVTSLLSRTLAWFTWLFLPPDEVAHKIRALAAQPWQGTQLVQLEQLVTNDHHLRLFLGEITDPAWLEPLRKAGLVGLPSPNSAWPVAALLVGLGRTHADHVAALLGRLLADVKDLPATERLMARYELLRVAFHLGSSGYAVVAEVVRCHPAESAVRGLGVDVARKAHPADPVVGLIANAVLNDLRKFGDGDTYYATELLGQLQTGLTNDNIAERARMLAAKTRRMAGQPEAGWTVLGIEALTVEVGEHPDPLLLLAHHLVHMLSAARSMGIATTTLLEWLGEVPGALGDRIRCQVLADADDADLVDKIELITRRVASSTATGDDLALVLDILTRDSDGKHLAAWASALGSPGPRSGEDRFPQDWKRAWRWAAVLPTQAMTEWHDAIDQVSASWGSPDQQALIGDRTDPWQMIHDQSPYSADDLAALPVLEAAELVASWHPSATGHQFQYTSEALADVLEETVGRSPERWSTNATTVVTTLRDPCYVLSYLRAITKNSDAVTAHAPALIGAIAHIRGLPPADATSGTADIDDGPDAAALESALFGLVRTLANSNADISADLDELWVWGLTPVKNTPTSSPALTFTPEDALGSAINRPWGWGLQTVLALASWESRHQGWIRSEFEQVLDTVIGLPGAIGLEFRAILARRRALLEQLVPNWLNEHAGPLLREGDLGRATFDLTVKWGRPTHWLYQHFRSELFDAAMRGVDGALNRIVAAVLHQEAGYDVDRFIRLLKADPAVLVEVNKHITWFVRVAEPDAQALAMAVTVWTRMLDADRNAVPAQTLLGYGGWAFVANLDDEQWARLTARTLDITDGRIDNVMRVADRAARCELNSTARLLLLRMVDKGEPWERDYVAQKALDVLRASTDSVDDDTFHRLRTRLVDLGYHQADVIIPRDHE